MHTKVGWQEVDRVEGRGRREEEGKEAQLTRDFKQKTKVEKQRQNRIEIMTYRRKEPTARTRLAHARARARESVQFGTRRGGRGTLDVSLPQL